MHRALVGATLAAAFVGVTVLAQSTPPAPNAPLTPILGGKKFTVASDDVPAAWGKVNTATVHLLKWKITFTTPAALVGNLYYQVDPGENIYDFTTTKN